MMKKRIVSLGLAAMMTAGLFAGCGNSSESQGDSTASGSKSDDIVTLKWVTIGSGMPDNYDSWVKKVNDYVGEKIGVNIDIEETGTTFEENAIIKAKELKKYSSVY